MYKYHCLNPISEVGLGELDENYVVTENPDEADAIFVRSATRATSDIAASRCGSAIPSRSSRRASWWRRSH